MVKYFKSGNVVEYYKYNFYIGENNGGNNATKKKSEKRKEEYKERTSIRKRNRIRRLVLCNFTKRDKFITLTFAKEPKNVQDVRDQFRLFQKRLRYYLKDEKNYKYIAVIERGEENNRLHLHIIANISYIKTKNLQAIWNNGFVKINAIKHVDNIGAYVIKYMNKKMIPRNTITSRGLEKPESGEIKNIKDLINIKCGGKIVREISYDYKAKDFGNINYKQYTYG